MLNNPIVSTFPKRLYVLTFVFVTIITTHALIYFNTAVALNCNATTIHINFQTDDLPAPTCYLSDTGNIFGDRGNGYNYGWQQSNITEARYREHPQAPDERYDTLSHMQRGGRDARWELAVANGWYLVHLVAGDPEFANGSYYIDVEGTLTVAGTPNKGQHWIAGSQIVEVTDGRLTVSNNTNATGNNKLSFIEVTPLMGAPGAFSAKINFQPDTIPPTNGYMIDSGHLYNTQPNGFTYGWQADNRAGTRNREWPTALDERFDTLIHMQTYGDNQWEIEVPNGTYALYVMAGDPRYFIDHIYQFEIEGQTVADAQGITSNRLRSIAATAVVEVTDNRLTIANGDNSSRNKLHFIELQQIGAAIATEGQVGITPPSQPITVGDTFTVTVAVTGIETAVTAYQFDLTYDATLLTLRAVNNGTFLETATQETICPPWRAPAANSVRFACVGAGPTVGTTGNGHLATLTFTALDSGLSNLTLTNIQFADTAVPPNSVDVSSDNGQITINDATPLLNTATNNSSNGGIGALFAPTSYLATFDDGVIGNNIIALFTLTFFLAFIAHLSKRRQLKHIWRVVATTSLLLQLIPLTPITYAATHTINESATTQHTPERIHQRAVPPTANSLNCYHTDIDCDNDIDEGDVVNASNRWDCNNGSACFNGDADLDNNNIIDAFDLAWIANDYDITPPLATISTPIANEVIPDTTTTVTGVMTDTHTVLTITVNGVVATLNDDTFSAEIPLEPGNQVIDLFATDIVGQSGATSQIIFVDDEGPMVHIQTPPAQQAIYTLLPTIAISYTDFYATIDSSTLNATLIDNNGTTIDITADLTPTATGAIGTLTSPLQENNTYTLTITIADSNGHIGSDSHTFYVPANADTIIPPVGGVAWATGTVYEASSCDTHLTTCQGLAGARVTAAVISNVISSTQVISTIVTGELNGAIVTGPDGFFAFPLPQTGHYTLRIEKDGYTYGQRIVSVVKERGTAVADIYLTPIDTAVTPCDSNGCTHVSSDGLLRLDIPPGAIRGNESIDITATNYENVEFLPGGELPPGTWETYAFNLGGDSEIEFTEPVTVSIQNYRGFAPGTIIPLGYWNQTTLQWEHEGTGYVDETGQWVIMHVTHFSNFDCNDPVTRPDVDTETDEETEEDDPCEGEEGCFINRRSGHLQEWIDLPATNVMGEDEAPRLIYNSNRANPSEVIDLRFSATFNPDIVQVNDYSQFELFIDGRKTDEFTFFANLDGSGRIQRYRYLWDGRDSSGNPLPPGVYSYAARLRLPYTGQWYWSANNRFGGPPDLSRPTGVFVEATIDVWSRGFVTLNSQPDSSFGSGWTLNEQQYLYQDENGNVLIIDGETEAKFYFDLRNRLGDFGPYERLRPPVIGPAGETVIPIEPTAGTLITGTILTDTIWTQANSPYILKNGDVQVADNVTLTVEPGTTIMLDQFHNLQVDGNLQAVGTITKPITFTIYNDGFYYNFETFPISATQAAAGSSGGGGGGEGGGEGECCLEGKQTINGKRHHMQFESPINAAAMYNDGNTIWFAGFQATYNEKILSLHWLDTDTYIWEAKAVTIDFLQGTCPFNVYDLAVDATGKAWVGTSQGIFALEVDHQTWTHYIQGSPFCPQEGKSNGRSVAKPYHQDGEEGGEEGGTGNGTTTSATINLEQAPLPNNDVTSVAHDQTGNIWFGTEGGVARYTPSSDSWNIYTTSNSGLAGNIITVIEVDASNNIWIGTQYNGLSQFDTNNVWTTYNASNSGLLNNVIKDIAFDEHNNIWLAQPSGLALLRADNSWRTFTAVNSDLQPTNVREIVVDSNDNKWLVYTNGNMSMLAANNIAWEHHDVPQRFLSQIVATPNGQIWSRTTEIALQAVQRRLYSLTFNRGYWGQIQLGGGSNRNDTAGSRLSHVHIEGGGTEQKPSLYLFDTAVQMDNLTIQGSGGDALYAYANDGFTLENATITNNDGRGIAIENGAGTYTMTAVTIDANNGHGIWFDHDGTATIDNATIANNEAYAIFVQDAASLALRNSTINDNTYTARIPANTQQHNNQWINNSHPELYMLGGTLESNVTWGDSGITDYVLFNDLTVSDGITLTLITGTHILFTSRTGDLFVNGKLIAIGSEEDPIRIGRYRHSNATWGQLVIGGGDVVGDSDGSQLSYVLLQRGGYRFPNDVPVLQINQSAVSLDHMTFVGNLKHALFVDDSAGVTITDSNFKSNAGAALVNNTPTKVISATNNYWGSPSGPDHTTNPLGEGEDVTDGVLFTPWRQKPLLIDGVQPILKGRSTTDYSTMTYDPLTETFTRHYLDGREVHFNSNGRHHYTLDPDGRRRTYTYNTDGTVATMQITAPSRATADWVWSFEYTNGKLTNITDPANRVTDVTVDTRGHLREVHFPDNSTRRFFYDSRGLLTHQQDQEGAITAYGYDTYGRITTHLDPPRPVYDVTTGNTELIRERRTYTHSDTSYPLINDSPVGTPLSPAPPVPFADELIDRVDYGRGGNYGYTSQWGSWTQKYDGLARLTTYQYNERNQPTIITYPDGDCILTTYNRKGQIMHTQMMGQTECALPASQRDKDEIQIWRYSYESKYNQVRSIRDPLNNYTYYSYGSEGTPAAGKLRLLRHPIIEDENGVEVRPFETFTYNSLGLLETARDKRGTITRYIYTQGTAAEASNGSNPLFAIGVTPVPGLLTQIIEDDGGINHTTIYRNFDEAGNYGLMVAPGNSMTTTYTYDAFNRPLSETDALGVVSTYTYDGRGNLIQQIQDFTSDHTSGRNVISRYTYDIHDNLLTAHTTDNNITAQVIRRYDINRQLAAYEDGLGNLIQFTYDDADQLVSMIDAVGNVATYSYTSDGKLERIIDEDGFVTRYRYDGLNRLATEIRDEGRENLITRYEYDLNDNLTKIIAPDDSEFCAIYDSHNRLTTHLADCGGLDYTFTYTYDLNNNVSRETDVNGSILYHQYDALNREISETVDEGGVHLTTNIHYDWAGNIEQLTDERGVITFHTYDKLNQLVQRCQDQAGLNLCTRFTYDSLNNQQTMTDPKGITTRMNYDAFGNLQETIEDVGGLYAMTNYRYDNGLNRIRMTDANGNVTQYNYTPRFELATTIYADGTVTANRYDGRGNLIEQVNQDNSAIIFTYDGLDRLREKQFSTGGWQRFDYDEISRLSRAEQSLDEHNSLIVYDYNTMGDIVSQTQSLDDNRWSNSYVYDYAANVYTTTYPSGQQTAKTFDALDRLKHIRWNDTTTVATYDYQNINSYFTIATANGITNQFDYDSLYRITQVNSALADYRYGYDAANNRTYTQYGHQPNQPVDLYEYDNLHQLTSVWYGANDTTVSNASTYRKLQIYTLDRLGNRLAVQDGEDTNTYSPNNGTQLLEAMNRYTQVNNAPFAYDPRGNLRSDEENSYDYDILNRQLRVTNNNGTTEYLYDALDRRIAKVISGTVATHYLYDYTYQVLEEHQGDGTLAATYIYGADWDEPLAIVQNGNIYYYHSDALGNITEISDETGNLVERYHYDVYGNAAIVNSNGVTQTTSTIHNPYRFTGRRYDDESGNYYYRARYYNPQRGRFLSHDPIGTTDDIHLYAYVGNNPLIYTDPSGESRSNVGSPGHVDQKLDPPTAPKKHPHPSKAADFMDRMEKVAKTNAKKGPDKGHTEKLENMQKTAKKNLPKSLYRKARRLAKLGGVSAVLLFLLDVQEALADEANDPCSDADQEELRRLIGELIGSILGGLAAGAVAGSVVPGLGTVGGAIVGAIGGLIGGTIGGEIGANL